MSMDLNEFVSETLTQIFTGVQAAQEIVNDMGGQISPSQICKNYGKDALFVHLRTRKELTCAILASIGDGRVALFSPENVMCP